MRNRGLAGVKFRRQFPGDKFILDFYSPEYKICVEADGGQHYTEEGELLDNERTQKLSELGITVLRFSNRDILNNMEGVYDVINKAIESRTPPHLNPLPQGERK